MTTTRRHSAFALATALSLLMLTCLAARAADGQATQPTTLPTTRCTETGTSIRNVLVHARVSKGTGTPISIDPIQSAMVDGTFTATGQGWRSLAARPDGSFEADELGGGYAYAEVESDREQVMLLHASGHTMVYFNGEPRAGDVYSTGYLRLPVKLNVGTNRLLFQGGRGQLSATLEKPDANVAILRDDATLPDVVAGHPLSSVAGIVVANCTNKVLNATGAAGTTGSASQMFKVQIPPMTIRKVVVPVVVDVGPTPETKAVVLKISLGAVSTDFSLRIRGEMQTRKITFVSKIDGSVQYYALVPASGPAGPSAGKALVLSLHGASVEATSQADAYSPKPWCDIVCPTNRRPYGFDWEDWGRKDGMEVLELAKLELQPDPTRIYLTGHSMGGHGTWQFGAQFPGTFAGLGPSAGWISFASYSPARAAATGPSSRPSVDAFKAAALPSDTLALKENYKWAGIYILHGDKDDNVPIEQARKMAEELAKFHHDYQLFEQKGAGHWWSEGDEPGARCVDWRPMFRMFAEHRLVPDDELTEISFATASPAINSKVGWVEIMSLETPGKVGRVDLKKDPRGGRIYGTTENIDRLSLVSNGGALTAELDGQKVVVPADAHATAINFKRVQGTWSVAADSTGLMKSPASYGPLKEAFNNTMIFAYATGGTAEENALSYAKARYDAETWYYRGNGGVDIWPDTEVVKALSRHDNTAPLAPSRNVIIYGNADTNKAWVLVDPHCPIRVTRAGITVGNENHTGDGLYAAFCYPMQGGHMAAVIAPTGIRGARASLRLPIFASSVYWPDYAVIDASCLKTGLDGIKAAGFFDNNWSIK